MHIQKTIKRIIYAIVILIASILLFNIIAGLWAGIASYETVINNELLILLPSEVKIGDVYILKEKSFKSTSGDSSYKYPDFFTLQEEEFDNGKILYHVKLTHKNPNVHCFIQVWNIDEPMELVLSKYKITSEISGFDENRLKINDDWCIQWDYIISDPVSGEKYKSRQLFIDRGDKMYSVSLFSPRDTWTKNKCDKIFKSLSHSLRLLK